MDALTDDYYEVMDLKFLLAEYERTQLDRQRFAMRLSELKLKLPKSASTKAHATGA